MSTSVMENDPLNSQVGGAHYKKYKVQPIEFAMANNLNYCQANAIKYITRYRDKGGKEDLAKAIHNIEILMKLEYPNTSDSTPYFDATGKYMYMTDEDYGY